MSFFLENIKKWLYDEIVASGDPRLFLQYIQDALDEIEEEMDRELEERIRQSGNLARRQRGLNSEGE